MASGGGQASELAQQAALQFNTQQYQASLGEPAARVIRPGGGPPADRTHTHTAPEHVAGRGAAARPEQPAAAPLRSISLTPGCLAARRVADTLRRLQKAVQNDDDPKIASNVAVTEYYLRGATDPEDLLDALAKIRCVRRCSAM
jgi:hypothetical protein